MAISIREYESFFLGNQGILLFHGGILLVALIAAAFFLVRKPRRDWIRGFLLGFGVILLQGIGLATDLLGSMWNQPSLSLILANVDRSLELLTLTGVLWFFLFPRQHKAGDVLLAVWTVLVLFAAAGTSAYLYVYPTAGGYNGILLSFIWDSIRTVFLVIGLLLTVARKPEGWGLSSISLVLFLTGGLLQLSLGDPSTYLPGFSRLCDLLAFPFAAMRLTYRTGGGGASVGPGSPARQIREAAAETIPQLSELILSHEPQDLPQVIAAWVCSAMRAEVTYFVASSENGDSVEFISGYDWIGSQALPGFLTSSESVPQLHFAVSGCEILRLKKNESNISLKSAADRAGLPQAGPALYAPLPLGNEAQMGILLLAAYSGEEWREEDEAIARAFADACSAAFRQMHESNLLRQSVETAQQETARLRQESEQLQTDRMNLETRLEQAEQEWRNERQRAEGLASLVQEQDSGQTGAALPEAGSDAEKQWMLSIQQKEGAIHQLQEELETTRAEMLSAQREASRFKESAASEEKTLAENQRLQEELRQYQSSSGGGPSSGEGFANVEVARLRSALEESEQKYRQEVSRIQGELRKTLTEYAHLQSALLQPPHASETGKKLTFEADVGMVTGLIAEIRQPFSSMVGYTDLLLSESAGILGGMQRKFLDRIRASITRTEALFEDLLQLLLLPEKIATPRIQPVDVASVIDGAITGASEVVREKNIVLRLDIDEEMPPVEIDRDALQQILNHLVQNAVLITPPEKEVVVTTHTPLAEQNQQLGLLITVKDSGPGIPAEDQPRVFTRLYRTEGPLIEGLGDTGVGMAVARTLSEAMGGRIWLESQIGQGTTFFVLLPVQIGEIPSPELSTPDPAS
jgi:signal transduction histidine kinase